VFSQPVLLALVSSGLTRDEAYRIVQRNAMRAWDEGMRLPWAARSRPRRRRRTLAAVLDEAFDLRRSLRHIGEVFDQLDALEM
jgi:adenylosuccinate lyase